MDGTKKCNISCVQRSLLVNSFEVTNHLTANKQEAVYDFKLAFTFYCSTEHLLTRFSFSLAG